MDATHDTTIVNRAPHTSSTSRALLRAEPVSGTECLTYTRRRTLHGFTLVELLMVIVIIGILVALVTLAVGGAVKKANQAKVLTEINQLSMALENYQQKHGSYPPNPGTEPTIELPAAREQRIERHLRRAFPRYVVRPDWIAPNNVANFDDIVEHIRVATGNNLRTMDGAEALVFFLGGLPNPTASNPLTGFAADAANPFQNITAQSQRTERFFEFDPTRLVDRDGDGWPEYVPDIKTGVVETAPYVYFDAGSYHLGSHYPFTHFNPAPDPGPRLSGLWGYAVPYAAKYVVPAPADGGDPADPRTWNVTAWQAPNNFQIICTGLDGQYGGRFDPISQPAEDQFITRVHPTGEGYKTLIPLDSGQPLGSYLDLDSDNLTNFSESPIGDVEVGN